MKKNILFYLTLTIFLFFPKTSSAQLMHPYKFDVSVSGTTITATLSDVEPANQAQMKVFTQKQAFLNGMLACTVLSCEQPAKEIIGNTIKWTITKGIVGNTDYNIRAEGEGGIISAYISPVIKKKTGPDVISSQWPLTYAADNTSAWISGQINNPSPSDFKETILQYSRSPFEKGTNGEYSELNPPEALSPQPAQWEESANATLGVGPDGKYGFKLTNLSPGTVYYVKQIIKSVSRGVTEIKVDKFNSTKGYTAEGSVDEKADYNKRTYTLLAPLPGLTVLFDQDLCREYVAEGKPVPGGDCDNQLANFINLLIKIIIGLAAIVLVVQLIIQGYIYMVTDVPFLKAGAKSRFFDALFGLLLAMASYLILNTINPKLVNGTLSVNGVDVGVDNPEGTGAFDFDSIKSLSSGGKISCPNNGGQASIANIAQSFVGKVSYNQDRRNSVVNNDIYLDCSSYVATVLDCAGYSMNRSSTTVTIFNSPQAEKINKSNTDYSKNIVNGILLKPGDLIGWPATSKSGHVLIYIGNGTLAETHGPTYPTSKGVKNGATRTIPLSTYSHQNQFTHIKRI